MQFRRSGFGGGLKARHPGAKLLGAAAVRQLFEQALIGLDGRRLLASELLGAALVGHGLFVEEILRLYSANDRLIGVFGCVVVLLSLPAVADIERRQRCQTSGAGLGARQLVACPRLWVLVGGEAQASEEISGLGHRGQMRIVSDNRLE